MVKEACIECGKEPEEGEQLLVCSACHGDVYCSAACQRADWKRHKAICKAARAARQGAAS